MIVSDIAIFVLKRDVKLQRTNYLDLLTLTFNRRRATIMTHTLKTEVQRSVRSKDSLSVETNKWTDRRTRPIAYFYLSH